MNLIGKIFYKIIPEHWYMTKRVCDLIEKFCTDPVLRSDIKVYIGITAVIVFMLVVCFCYYITYKIKKLRK
ncbi:MAG: hypothetical protein LBG48_05705 [Rickettsiales bacterium]|jgi:hypothetical protein|nr:hypothetical protein [Rickettsiales bacterium]